MSFYSRKNLLAALQVPEWAQFKVENAMTRISNAGIDPKSPLHPGVRIACTMARSTPAYAFANPGIGGANEEGVSDGKRIFIPLGYLGSENEALPEAATDRMVELLCVKLGMALNARENKNSKQPLYFCSGFPTIGSINPSDFYQGLSINGANDVILQLDLETHEEAHHEDMLATLKYFDVQSRRMSAGEKNEVASWLIQAGYYPLNPREPLNDHLCALNAYFQGKVLDAGMQQVKQQKARSRL